jgi:small conductance mechanosensitive channel
VLAILVWEIANAAIEQHLARLAAEAHLARAGRLRTLLPMLRSTLLVTIVLVVALTILDELGVNIAPLLAGAGVIGIAIGFGSQKLVQDLITGLFLLLENAMQVGDVVTLGGLSGTVEALSIRTIRLRALDGSVHIVPFSAVTTVTNQTRDYGYALLDISVGLNEEPDRIIPIVRDLAAEVRRDPKWASLVLEPLDVMGIEKFVDTAWVLRVRMKTQPASRWSVGRELNRRVKLRFDELAIESPLTSYRVLSGQPAPVAVQEHAA